MEATITREQLYIGRQYGKRQTEERRAKEHQESRERCKKETHDCALVQIDQNSTWKAGRQSSKREAAEESCVRSGLLE